VKANYLATYWRARARRQPGKSPAAFALALEADSLSRTALQQQIRTLPDRRALQLSRERAEILELVVEIAAQDLTPQYRAVAWDRVVRTRGLVRSEFANWPAEPFIRTGYSCPAPGQVMTLLLWMQEGIADRIFFAGEHVSPPFFGFMEGALQTGLAAAGRIALAAGISLPAAVGVLTGTGIRTRIPSRAPVLWLPRRMLDAARAPNQRLVARISSESFIYPTVNVVAAVTGTGATLKREYVLFSGHQDHDGVRAAVGGDSIWNGADDNASVSVALLAIGRAFAAHPAPRGALFVWHGAEERGLIGSRWFAQHPTVPKASIVAVLNGDMIGRNAPGSAALLGVVPPHRNSTALVAMALRANRRVGGFALDSTWDSPTHPEGWYFRSDHLPYARAGIPAIFFTTLLHPDYHTPRDEAARIDYAKLTRMTRWMYATGWAVATAAVRPGLDPGFRLER